MSELFTRFSALLRSVRESEIKADVTLSDRLILARAGKIAISYAPFEHIQDRARIVLVGITPGAQQASNALIEARRQLVAGADNATALKAAKTFASFSGAMRSNLVSMLDHIGVSQWLGLGSTSALWSDRTDLVHFTSAIRYPAFIDGKNYNGQPAMSAVPLLKDILIRCLAEEARALSGALWIPLGPVAEQGVTLLVREGIIGHSKVLSGLPHPSPANVERIMYFVGQKPRHLLSAKTNAEKLDGVRSSIMSQVAALPPAE